MNRLLTLSLLLCIIFGAKAQELNVFYFTPNIPQAVYLNPAKHNTQRKVVVGIAALNGIYGSVNSDASLSDVLSIEAETNKTTLNIEKLGKAINGDGEINQQFSVPLLFLGLNFKNNHFYFSASEKQPLSIYFTDDVLKIIKNGNAPYAGQTTEAQLDMQLFHYGEYALGYSRDMLDKKLTVGATMKFLFGKGAIKADNIKLGVYTHPDGDYIDLSGTGGLYFSGPFDNAGNTLDELQLNEDISATSYLTNHTNPGFAVDLGATYQVNPKINIAVSVTDLGSIKWEKQVSGYNLTGAFNWQGVDVSDGFTNQPNISEELLNLADSLGNSFTFNSDNSAFKTQLTTKLYMGGSLQLNDMLNLSVVNRVSFHPTKNVSNMFMLSANANFGNILSLTGSYAVTNGSYNNFGMGLGVRAGFAQFILGTNNVYQLFYLDEVKYASIRFGVNLMFGKINQQVD